MRNLNWCTERQEVLWIMEQVRIEYESGERIAFTFTTYLKIVIASPLYTFDISPILVNCRLYDHAWHASWASHVYCRESVRMNVNVSLVSRALVADQVNESRSS